MVQGPRSVFLFLVFASFAFATSSNRYALVLEEATPAAHLGRYSPQAASHRQTALAAQATVKSELLSRNLHVTGAVQSVVNAVFVQATPDREPELHTLPGVKYVVRLGVRYPKLDRAVQLVNAPAAWNLLGGIPNAGAGMKIGIIDTGIDQNHPAFNDPSLPAVPHICSGADCAFTNNKVIVARSYVRQLAAGTLPNPAADSRPDDYSPRDHVGHGTAVAMVAAGITNTGPSATITGLAPKAYLGNYKVYGSPGVNDGASDDVLIQAIEDALSDGMDVVNLSSGGPAFTGPLDTGAACGKAAGTPCDLLASAYNNAAAMGMVVVVAAGNEGDTGSRTPTLATIGSPAGAPNVIAVGAVSNSHDFDNGIMISGPSVPANLQQIQAAFGDGPVPDQPLSGRLKDVASVGDPLACVAAPAASMSGFIAIAQRGTCNFVQKVQNLQTAGAIGVIFTTAGATDQLVGPGGLTNTTIPAVMISLADGQNLRAYLDSNPTATATIDLSTLTPFETTPNLVSSFTSRGPGLGTGAIKPELMAIGEGMYMAAQSTDPSGELYSASGYLASQGTSFSSPMVAGAAALVKQRNANYSASQIRSALVNTASSTGVTELSGSQPRVTAIGGGKLDVGTAVSANVAITPPTASFGVLKAGSLPASVALTITNGSTAPVTLGLTVTRRDTDANTQIALDRPNLTLAAGASAPLNLVLSGTLPAPGNYEGQINIAGAATALHVPFLYTVGTNSGYNIVTLAGYGETGTVNETVPDGLLALQVTDRYGVPVSNALVTFTVGQGGGTISQADSTTDQFGIAGALAKFGPSAGAQVFNATAGGLSTTFQDAARLKPTIAANGIVNAASFQPGQGIAPGSYISIFGTGLSDDSAVASRATLPLSLHKVTVSFDVPSANLSLPGAIYYVSPGQVNVQVPWGLAGQKSVQVKVSIEFSSGVVFTVPVTPYSPSIFQYGSGTLAAAALDENSLVIGSANPARRGHAISLFANGLGPVNIQLDTGAPAPSSPLATLQAVPTVTVGGVPATVQFSGLAPGFSGLDQLNIVVPPSVPAGVQPVVVTVNGVASPAASLNVQ